MKLIDALLATSAGPELRRILHLPAEHILAELLYVSLRRAVEKGGACEVCVCLAALQREVAAEVVFRCAEVSAWDWHSSFYEEKDIPSLEPTSSEIAIDAEDCFRIVCKSIEVLSVKPESLGGATEEGTHPGDTANAGALASFQSRVAPRRRLI